MQVNKIPNLIIHYYFMYGLILMHHVFNLYLETCSEIPSDRWVLMHISEVGGRQFLKV